jgi:hypothetical protein
MVVKRNFDLVFTMGLAGIICYGGYNMDLIPWPFVRGKNFKVRERTE